MSIIARNVFKKWAIRQCLSKVIVLRSFHIDKMYGRKDNFKYFEMKFDSAKYFKRKKLLWYKYFITKSSNFVPILS